MFKNIWVKAGEAMVSIAYADVSPRHRRARYNDPCLKADFTRADFADRFPVAT